jgi:hypothetical protein
VLSRVCGFRKLEVGFDPEFWEVGVDVGGAAVDRDVEILEANRSLNPERAEEPRQRFENGRLAGLVGAE